MRYDAAAIAAAELRFREGIWSAAPSDAVDELEIRKQWCGPILATIYAGLRDSPMLNMVQGAAEPGAVEGGHLANAVEWLRSWEVDDLVPVASDRPDTDPPWVSEESAAFVEVRKLSIDQTEGMSLIFADVLGLSDLATVSLLGLPRLEGWHCYAAYLEGREVACGAMLVDSGTAMLGLDATSPEGRRRGCHTALIRRRLIDAAGARCDTALAEACGAPGERSTGASNLQRAGFIEAGRSTVWHRPLRA
jgi:hypothetical protein